MIDVIIPAYNAHSTIKKTLSSIAMQTIKDLILVTIVDDCSTKDYKEEIDLFKDKINIRQIKLSKNSGPGVARQYGIDNTSGEFILFIDSDDLLFNIYSLENIYNCAKENDSELVIGILLVELSDKVLEYNNHQANLHGKLYKRKFLENNKIRFNNTKNSEDNSFNRLVLLLDPKIDYCNEYIYVYKNNKNSITNKDSNYSFSSIRWFSYNMVWAIKEGEKRNVKTEGICKLILESLSFIYYNYNVFNNKKDKNKLIDWSKELYEYYLKYDRFINSIYKYELLFSSFDFEPTTRIEDFFKKYN